MRENFVAKNKKDFIELEKIFIIKTLFFKNKKNLNKKNKLRNFMISNHKKTKRNYLEYDQSKNTMYENW